MFNINVWERLELRWPIWGSGRGVCVWGGGGGREGWREGEGGGVGGQVVVGIGVGRGNGWNSGPWYPSGRRLSV